MDWRSKRVIDAYNAARQRDREDYLRTPEGNAERQKRNAETVERMREDKK